MPKLNNILLLTDSLGLVAAKNQPPDEPHVSYGRLIVEIINEFSEVVNLDCNSLTGRTFKMLSDELPELIIKHSDKGIVVVQVGIVDCAPRILGNRGRRFVGRIRPSVVRSYVTKLLSKLHKRWFFYYFGHRVFVPLREFENSISSVVKTLRTHNVLHIAICTIAPVPAEKEYVYVGFNENVAAYNASIRRVGSELGVDVIQIDEVFANRGDELYDGIHPNYIGKKRIAETITKQILLWQRQY